MTSQRRRIAARRKEKETGSLIDSEPVFVVVGILRRPHGLHGEVLVSLETDFPERLQKGARLYLGDDYVPVTIAGSRQHNDGLLLTLEEFPGKQAVEPFRNLPLFIKTADSPALPAGQYYQHQLLGLEVVEETGAALGKLAQILDTGANDVYVVRSADGAEVLLPAIKDVILKVDLAEKRLTVHLLPGLRELSAK